MTREEQTISNLKKLKSFHNGSYGTDIDRAIKALEQEPCEDAISRQAAQDYIAKYLSQYLYNDVREAVEAIDEYIGELPPVTQKPETVTEFADRCRECGAKYGKLLKQEPCEDCISRQIISDYVESHIQEINTGYGDLNEHTNRILRMIMKYIDKLPPAKLQEPKTGHWINNQNGTYTCDKCGGKHSRSNYCPNCGCRMVDPQESESKE